MKKLKLSEKFQGLEKLLKNPIQLRHSRQPKLWNQETTLILEKASTQEKLDLLSQLLQNDYKFSRGKRIASTILLITSGVILYTENILDTLPVKKFLSLFKIEYDLHEKGSVPAFDTLTNMIYAIDMAISPTIFIVILFFRMKPYKWAFIVPLYGYINMLIGTIILARGYEIFDIWWYRFLIFIGAGIICWILSGSLKYFDASEKSDRLKNMILENYRKQLKKDEAA